MSRAAETAIRPARPGPSIAATLACAGLTISLWIGNAALLAALFPDGGRAVALAFLLTTGFLAGNVHGVALSARARAPRSVLYLTAVLSWTVAVSIFLLVLAGLTTTQWPTLFLTLGAVYAAGLVPVAAGLETSRAWLAGRWAAARTDETPAPNGWADSIAKGGGAC